MQYIQGLTLVDWEGVDRKSYPYHLPAVSNWRSLPVESPLTCFVGENGSGKSTLLEAIAVAWGINAEGGSRNFNFATHDAQYPLANHLRLVKGIRRPKNEFFLRAESFYNVANEIERLDKDDPENWSLGPKVIDGYGGKSLHEQSHGEAFWATFMHRFHGQGLFLLDEPESALSPLRQMALLRRVDELLKNGCQIIMATHSPLLLAHKETDIWQFDQKGITTHVPLEETEHYRIWWEFITHRERMLAQILDDL